MANELNIQINLIYKNSQCNTLKHIIIEAYYMYIFIQCKYIYTSLIYNKELVKHLNSTFIHKKN